MRIIKALTLGLFLSLGAKAMAQSAYITPYVTFNPIMAQAQICNYYPRPVLCHAQLNAQTQWGPMLYGYLNYQRIVPGLCAYVYVNSNYQTPIVHAWANAYCQFTY